MKNKMAKKNAYEKKAHQKQMLNGTLSEAAGKTATKVSAAVTDIVVGGLLGATAGAVVGRGSFYVGIAMTSAGHYFGSRAAAAFGVGMMATGGYQMASLNGSSVNGIQGMKERLKAFTEDLKHRLFIDKIIKSKKATGETAKEEVTNGVGEVQYFNYPNKELEGSELDFNALDNIERQIAESANKHAAKQKFNAESGSDMGAIEDYNL